ncbi:MAG: ABC transporter ATP-binding protein [Ruminococcaceae bacterium]|nr:ABC transporter ATP-binding protein [Oscillospiraceae bacterium]
MMVLKNVSYSYSSGFRLEELSLELKSGELLAVLGPNGAGKSTLLKLAASQLTPNKGELLLDGKALSQMKVNEVAKQIAYLSQVGFQSDLPVKDVVLHGRFPHTPFPHHYGKNDLMLAKKAMEQTGLSDLADRPLSSLSGGEKQKALIAMALCQNSKTLLLDEPTAFLDPSHRFALMETLSSLAEDGKSILCILHDIPLALRYSHRIAVLEQGRLLSVASPEDTLKSGILTQVFGIEIGKSTDGFYYYAKKNDAE